MKGIHFPKDFGIEDMVLFLKAMPSSSSAVLVRRDSLLRRIFGSVSKPFRSHFHHGKWSGGGCQNLWRYINTTGHMDIRPWLHLVLSGILAFLIYSGYRQISTDVRLFYEGQNIKATVAEIEPRPKYFYVRVEYKFKDSTFTRSFRLNEPRPWKIGQQIEIRILSENPQVMSLEFNEKKLHNTIYYVFLVFILLVIYRSIWLLVKSTRPNYD